MCYVSVAITRWTKNGCCSIYLPPNLDVTLSMDVETNSGPCQPNAIERNNRNNMSNLKNNAGKLVYSRQQLLQLRKPKTFNHLPSGLVCLIESSARVFKKPRMRGKRAGRKLHYYGTKRITIVDCEKFYKRHENTKHKHKYGRSVSVKPVNSYC